MRIRNISILIIFVLSILAINCDRNISPFVPEIDNLEQQDNATLTGNVVLTGGRNKDVGLINVGVRGTNLRANVDENGYFRIDNLPAGNILVDIDIDGSLSYLPINDVKPGEDVNVEIGILGDDKSVFSDVTRKKKSKKQLKVTIKPDEWDTAWVSSTEDVTAEITGDGFGSTVFTSLQMTGPGGTAISPHNYVVGDKSFDAKFLRSAAIGIIANPVVGQSYVIKVTGSLGDGTTFSLTDTITIEEDDEEEELELEIEPDEWETTWANSTEDVTAKISGDGFSGIVATTLQMVGPEGVAISPYNYVVGDKSFDAKFLQSAVIGIIANPVKGQSYVIKVTGSLGDGTTFTLTDTITIEEDDEEEELELEIEPDEWETTWANSTGDVIATISGNGFSGIVATTVQMVGPGGVAVSPHNYLVGDKSFDAKFLRSAAIGIIANPVAGQSYVIKVTGSLGDGTTFSLMDTITIEEGLGLGIKPDEWNTTWASSTEDVTAKISGKGFDSIVATTVQMVGPEGVAISPHNYVLGDKSFEAMFLQSAAIGIIANPVTGQSYVIKVTGSLNDGTVFELTDTITIEEEGTELELGIKPDEWKTTWANSTGDVTAKISGKGFDGIVATTVQMVGPGGAAISPHNYVAGDKSFEAMFLQSAAIGIIANPVAGQSYVIKVTGSLSDGTVFELTDTITIEEEEEDEEEDEDEEEEDGELNLKIDPQKWNTNWQTSKGLVTARIKGTGYSKIDGDTVQMVGPEGDMIAPYSYKITGNAFMAKFLKQEAIGLILEPTPGDSHEIRVTGTFSDGSGFDLKYTIKIVGSKKKD